MKLGKYLVKGSDYNEINFLSHIYNTQSLKNPPKELNIFHSYLELLQQPVVLKLSEQSV